MSVTEDQVRLQRVLVQSGFHHTSIQGNMTEHNEENNPAFDYKQVPIFGIPWRHDEDDCHVLVKESHDKYAIRKLKCLRVKEHQVRAVDPHFGGYHLERLPFVCQYSFGCCSMQRPRKGAPKWLDLLRETALDCDELPTHAICRGSGQESCPTSNAGDFSLTTLEVPTEMIGKLNWRDRQNNGVAGWLPGADLQPWLPAKHAGRRIEKWIYVLGYGMHKRTLGCFGQLYPCSWFLIMVYGFIVLRNSPKRAAAPLFAGCLWRCCSTLPSVGKCRMRVFRNV
mmetsp:Transcript_3614/g.8261  ORF Transcript_3614/g.8261 Transcript_3614/m.8261 type:complete len:281 (+) Transcript_3614:370-1212(+)